jgi:hypothetical protein
LESFGIIEKLNESSFTIHVGMSMAEVEADVKKVLQEVESSSPCSFDIAQVNAIWTWQRCPQEGVSHVRVSVPALIEGDFDVFLKLTRVIAVKI